MEKNPPLKNSPRALDAFEISRLYWMLPLEERSWKRVAQILQEKNPRREDIDPGSKITQNRLARLARNWESRGRVRHMVFAEDEKDLGRAGEARGESYLPRLFELERALQARYALRGVVVADISRISRKNSPLKLNKVHQELGGWGGLKLLEILKPNSVFATGGGRGCYHTIAALERLNCSQLFRPQYNVRKIIALCAQRHEVHWENLAPDLRQSPQRMDADHNAGRASSLLSSDSPLRSDRHFGLEDPAGENRIRDAFASSIREAAIDVALIGIGIVAGGDHYEHELYLCPNGNRHLRAIEKELADFFREYEQVRDENLHIGEACNQFFITLTPDRISRAGGRYEKLLAALENLNRKMLGTPLAELQKINERGSVLAVAGGKRKAPVIRFLLESWRETGAVAVSHLVIDSDLALSLL